MFGYAVDIQTGVPRVWTGIATVSFVIGSLTLYDGISLSWITLLAGIVGMTHRHARRHAGDGPGPVLHARRSGASG